MQFGQDKVGDFLGRAMHFGKEQVWDGVDGRWGIVGSIAPLAFFARVGD